MDLRRSGKLRHLVDGTCFTTILYNAQFHDSNAFYINVFGYFVSQFEEIDSYVKNYMEMRISEELHSSALTVSAIQRRVPSTLMLAYVICIVHKLGCRVFL